MVPICIVGNIASYILIFEWFIQELYSSTAILFYHSRNIPGKLSGHFQPSNWSRTYTLTYSFIRKYTTDCGLFNSASRRHSLVSSSYCLAAAKQPRNRLKNVNQGYGHIHVYSLLPHCRTIATAQLPLNQYRRIARALLRQYCICSTWGSILYYIIVVNMVYDNGRKILGPQLGTMKLMCIEKLISRQWNCTMGLKKKEGRRKENCSWPSEHFAWPSHTLSFILYVLVI